MFGKRNPSNINNVKKIGIYIGVPKLGDLLFIIPLFRAFKNKYPNAEVVFIGKILHGYVLPVFNNCPYIDRTLEYHFYDDQSISAYSAFIAKLRAEKFDILVDTQRKFMPSILLSLGGAKHFISYSTNSAFSHYRVNTPDRKKRHTADVSLDLARAAGIGNPLLALELTLGAENISYANEFFAERNIADDELLAGFIPSAGNASRQWPVEKFGELAKRLNSELGFKLVFFGSENDGPVIRACIEASGTQSIIEDYSRKLILDSAALMQRCDVIVGVDSGPLHVADAVGAPCIGIYGPTLPERFGLIGPRTKEICLYEDCTPCSDHNCENRKCIENISVEMVFEAVKDLAINIKNN